MNHSTNGHSSSGNSPGPFPAQSWSEERAEAMRRKSDFPYRFPVDHRPLGGKFSVAQNAQRLLRFFYFERRLAQAIGAWTLKIPVFEVKLESGRRAFY